MKDKKIVKKHECIVIGGGAAGMMAAIALAEYGIDTCILEHTSRIGTKILQTGNGKCNFTNLNLNENMYQNKNKQWVMEVIAQYGVNDTLKFFKNIGVYYKEKNGYVYPLSMTAASLQNALRLELENKRVKIHTDTIVNSISCFNIPEGNGTKDNDTKGNNLEDNVKGKFIIKCEGIDYLADTVIIATGSKAAPKTGSDGTGYELVRQMGIKVNKPLPALVQLISDDKKLCRLAAGVRSHGKIELYADDRKVSEDEGEIQYTDYGISGIPVFQVSRYAVKALDEKRNVHAVIDMLPDIDYEEIGHILTYRVEHEGYKTIEQFFEGMVNRKLVSMVCRKCNIDTGTYISDIKISALQKLLDNMKKYDICIIDNKGFENGQICQGGVDTKGVSSKDMQSLKVKGLFFAGEVLDVDGKCGGYNLQWAWSSARVAATGVKKYIDNRM